MQGQGPLLRDQRFTCDSSKFDSYSVNAMMGFIDADLVSA
jgi:hypothetical protein